MARQLQSHQNTTQSLVARLTLRLIWAEYPYDKRVSELSTPRTCVNSAVGKEQEEKERKNNKKKTRGTYSTQ